MLHDIISKKTRSEFQETMKSVWTLREITVSFDDADILCDATHQPHDGSMRRVLVDQYYHSLDFSTWTDVKKLFSVYESVLQRIECQVDGFESPSSQWAAKTLSRLKQWLKKDGFDYHDGHITHLGGVPHIPQLKAVAEKADAAYLHQQIQRMNSSVETDPWLAIGTAKELIETTCRTILEDRGLGYDKGWELPRLVKETAKALKLTPDDIPESSAAAETIKKLLSNLATVAHGLAELRNPFGTGHGHTARKKGLQPRHARLAAGAAATLATFLYDTHAERTVV